MFVLMTAIPDSPIRDAGAPSALDGTPLAAQFRYWAGDSGRRYLSRVFPIDEAGDFAGAPVVLAAVDGRSRREAVWIGLAGGPDFAAALAAARAVGASEAHVHLLAESARERSELVHDLRAALAERAEAGSRDAASAPAGRRDVAA